MRPAKTGFRAAQCGPFVLAGFNLRLSPQKRWRGVEQPGSSSGS
jgi:hypothetical protein